MALSIQGNRRPMEKKKNVPFILAIIGFFVFFFAASALNAEENKSNIEIFVGGKKYNSIDEYKRYKVEQALKEVHKGKESRKDVKDVKDAQDLEGLSEQDLKNLNEKDLKDLSEKDLSEIAEKIGKALSAMPGSAASPTAPQAAHGGTPMKLPSPDESTPKK